MGRGQIVGGLGLGCVVRVELGAWRNELQGMLKVQHRG